MHDALDAWERCADDEVVHCVGERQAREVLATFGDRMQEVGLRLHPDKTRTVYCKDGTRRGSYEHESFTFLGFTFQPRQAQAKNGNRFDDHLQLGDRLVLAVDGGASIVASAVTSPNASARPLSGPV
ncbi:reverse transcriptase domain-containing protein [Kitasatospora purpeofusca]|uniref:reverse transcriptase domain-containing protein n=1 Tax=Kitasatospora purpeofusca TaxID=67352 RepID=UPI0035DECAAD